MGELVRRDADDDGARLATAADEIGLAIDHDAGAVFAVIGIELNLVEELAFAAADLIEVVMAGYFTQMFVTNHGAADFREGEIWKSRDGIPCNLAAGAVAGGDDLSLIRDGEVRGLLTIISIEWPLQPRA